MNFCSEYHSPHFLQFFLIALFWHIFARKFHTSIWRISALQQKSKKQTVIFCEMPLRKFQIETRLPIENRNLLATK